MEKILVVGASGMVGSELVKILTQKGHSVRQTTSRAQAPGKTFLNVVTGEGIRDAFEGIDRAFLLSPPGFADQHKTLSPLIQEAKRRGLKKVVLMTAMGANAVETSPFRRAELELEKSGLSFNIIRPNWFMQNFHTFWVQGINTQNKILLPAGNAKVSFLDARDISAVAAELLVNDRFSGEAFDLTGPQALDHQEVAQLLTKAVGRKISYQEIEPTDFRKGLLTAGLPADYADFLVMIMGFLKEGYSARITDSVEKITGKPARAFENYVSANLSAWKQ